MAFEFLEELHEARMTRNSHDQKVLTYTDCCERAYIILLALELLRRFPQTIPYAKGYAKQTSGYDSYKHFRMNGSDLYNFVYFIVGDSDAMEKLKDPKGAAEVRKTIQFPLLGFNRYVSRLAGGYSPSNNDQATLMNIETSLKIRNADYKSIRRSLFNFTSLSTRDKKTSVTKLLYAVRAKLRNSDIIPYIEELATERDLETKRVTDTEPKISTPDIVVTGQDLALYRYLVGAKNLILVKKFVELLRNNRSIPANIAQSYLPAVEILDDIVKAGPGYVSLLRALQNRAKKVRNR